MWVLMVLFVVTLFLPDAIFLQLGSTKLTPSLAISIVLFPVLLLPGRIRWTWPDAVVLLFFVLTTASIFMNGEAVQSIESTGRRVLAGMVPYMVGRYVGLRPGTLHPFLRLMLAILTVLGVFVVIETFFRWNVHSFVWQFPYVPHPEQRLGLTRAHGWTSHAIMLGLTYAAFLPVLLVAVKEKLCLAGRLPWIKILIFMAAIFCSLSTGAWLPAVIAVGFVAWDYIKLVPPATRWLSMFVGSIGGYFLLEVASGRPLLRILMMELHLSSEMAWYYRWQLFQRVYGVMPGHWWMGWGMKMPPAMAQSWQTSIDNNYLVILMQYGRVGLILWIGMMLAVLVYGWKSVWKAPDRPHVRVARAMGIAIVAVALTQLSVAMFSTAASVNWMLLGLAVGMAQGLRGSTKQEQTAAAGGTAQSSANRRGTHRSARDRRMRGGARAPEGAPA